MFSHNIVTLSTMSSLKINYKKHRDVHKVTVFFLKMYIIGACGAQLPPPPAALKQNTRAIYGRHRQMGASGAHLRPRRRGSEGK